MGPDERAALIPWLCVPLQGSKNCDRCFKLSPWQWDVDQHLHHVNHYLQQGLQQH